MCPMLLCPMCPMLLVVLVLEKDLRDLRISTATARCVSLITLWKKLKYLNGFISFHLDLQPFPHSFEFNEIKIEDFWLRLRSRENRNNGHFLVCVE